MKILLIIILSSLLSIFSCDKKKPVDNENSSPGKTLKESIEKTIRGEEKTPGKLGLFEKTELPIKIKYEKLIIDSLKIDKKNYYFSILEFSDPTLNRFAVYDNKLRLMLLDKSLNGDISVDFVDKKEYKFLRVVESFLSKNVINVKRLSLYCIDTMKVNLAFRGFISLVQPDAFLSQEFKVFTKDSIVTTITLPQPKFNGFDSSDVFVFNKNVRRYVSLKNYFDSIVYTQIKAFNPEHFH
ncbi:MAG: hypothetical protein WCJ01_10215 [Ignavibacteria bacterium]